MNCFVILNYRPVQCIMWIINAGYNTDRKRLIALEWTRSKQTNFKCTVALQYSYFIIWKLTGVSNVVVQVTRQSVRHPTGTSSTGDSLRQTQSKQLKLLYRLFVALLLETYQQKRITLLITSPVDATYCSPCFFFSPFLTTRPVVVFFTAHKAKRSGPY